MIIQIPRLAVNPFASSLVHMFLLMIGYDCEGIVNQGKLVLQRDRVSLNYG